MYWEGRLYASQSGRGLLTVVKAKRPKPTEVGPASEVAPTEIIPDQLSAASDESLRVCFC